jgi:hypothetical protein
MLAIGILSDAAAGRESRYLVNESEQNQSNVLSFSVLPACMTMTSFTPACRMSLQSPMGEAVGF